MRIAFPGADSARLDSKDFFSKVRVEWYFDGAALVREFWERRGFSRSRFGYGIAALGLSVVMAALFPFAAEAVRSHRTRPTVARERPLPYPLLALPLEISGSQYIPIAWVDVPGWAEGD